MFVLLVAVNIVLESNLSDHDYNVMLPKLSEVVIWMLILS